MAAEVRKQNGSNDHQATHSGRSAFDVVRGRSVVADQLAVAFLDQHQDGEPGAEQGAEQRDAAGDDNCLHPGPSRADAATAVRMSSATVSKARPRDAFTKTTSPGPRPAVTSLTASGLSATTTALDDAKPAVTAALVTCAPYSPIAMRCSTPTSAANRPIAACSSAALSPSSSMSPSTAQVCRPVPPSSAKVVSAARIDSGL